MPATFAPPGLRWLQRQLDPTAWPHRGLSPVNRTVIALIVLSVVTAVLDSEPVISGNREPLFAFLELGFGLVFGVEYLARLVIAPLNPQFGPGWRGVFRYAHTPVALVDLLALPPVLFGAVGTEAYVLRVVRLARVLRLAHLGRFSGATLSLRAAVRSRRYELMVSGFLTLLLLLVTSTLLYLAEGTVQPETFGSTPRAMWWSIATLTTVGYGDVVPHTPWGKLLAGMTAIISIGTVAMPTGILAAAFSDAMQREREAARAKVETATATVPADE